MFERIRDMFGAYSMRGFPGSVHTSEQHIGGVNSVDILRGKVTLNVNNKGELKQITLGGSQVKSLDDPFEPHFPTFED